MLVGIVSLAFLHRDGVAEDERGRRRRRSSRPSSQAAAGGAGRRRSRSTPTQAAIERTRPGPTSCGTRRSTSTWWRSPSRSTSPTTPPSANPFDWSAVRWIFLAFAVAFAVKVPLFPLHTWLPDAHTQAPTAGSVILAGVMLKLGTYGFVRFGLYLFPEASVWFAPGARHARRDRHHLRRHRRHDAARPEAARRLLLGGPPRVHHPRHLRPHHPGHPGRRDADGEPRHLHRRPLPPRRDDLRPPPHPRDRGAQGPAEVGADPGRRLHRW